MIGTAAGQAHATCQRLAATERRKFARVDPDETGQQSEKPRRRSRLERAGLSQRAERVLNAALALLIAVFLTGWTYAVAEAFRSGVAPPSITTVALNPLSADAPPPAAFLLDAAARRFAASPALHGESGDVRVFIANGDSLPLADSLPPDVRARYRAAERGAPADSAVSGVPAAGGIWNVLLQMRGAIRAVPDLNVITLVPLSARRAGRIGGYLIGEWPFESGGRPPSAAYAPPPGLVRVTPENQDLLVSRHFRLRDFLTKGQEDVWPKYVALSPRLLDKLELTIDALEEMGHPVRNVGVISGFRTPTYNRSGGDPSGRGALSRHMYGDAMDFFVDNDHDGRMDDLNGNGRVEVGDGRVMVRAAEQVEREYPHLIGGIGLYPPTGGHAGFIHVDTRGYRARW